MELKDLDELWVPIPGYPNYEVSSMGEIVNVKTGKILAHTIEKNGYSRVNLYVLGRTKKFYVHRLVAQAFFVDYSDERSVKLINNNFQDITVFNLQIGGPCRGSGDK